MALALIPLLAFAGTAWGAPAPKPKLVVAIIVDQFRYDYLTRFRQDYHGGLDQLLTQGADFTNAFYAQVPTVTHFSPYSYDRHVPVLFMGPGSKAGRYDETIRPNDIAPTLATMLDIQTPSGSSGRVLVEMLSH